MDKEKASTSFNGLNTAKNLEDAERRYIELFEGEKQRMKKKEHELKEVIQRLSKKVKVSEKKANDESRVAVELRKHYEAMKIKTDAAVKDKARIEE